MPICHPDVKFFEEALREYVQGRLLATCPCDDYLDESVRIADARNALFITINETTTDEEHDIYSLRSLCRLDADTMNLVPDEGRIRSIAYYYFGPL